MSWPLDRVVLSAAAASSRVVEPWLEAAIDVEWASQVARADGALTDGPAYRVEQASAEDGVLRIALALEPYRVHSAMKVLHADPRVTPAHHDRILVADALVRTRDDRVVLLRTPKVTGTELQLVGGTASPAQRPIRSTADLVAFTRQRVARALSGTGEIEVRSVLGLVDHVVGCVNVVLDVRVAAAVAELAPVGASELVVVDLAVLRGFLLDAPGYLPGVADLL
jgi:hypothetical protein